MKELMVKRKKCFVNQLKCHLAFIMLTLKCYKKMIFFVPHNKSCLPFLFGQYVYMSRVRFDWFSYSELSLPHT